MFSEFMPALRIGDKTAALPVVQGGMGVGISRAGLAAAVANCGGIGVIAAVGLDLLDGRERGRQRGMSSQLLQEEIARAKRLSRGLIGVNIMVALSDYASLVTAAIEARADLLFLGAGLPLHLSDAYTPRQLEGWGTRIVPIVSSARAAELIFSYWHKKYERIPDAVVVEGPLAGGHLGFKREELDDPAHALEKLVPEVVAALRPFREAYGKELPVIAAGGVFDGKDIYRMIRLGASGVQMATRFIATHECDADPAFKQALINARREDIAIIQSPVGLPGRAIRNGFIRDVEAGERKPFICPFKCLKGCDYKTAPYCIALALGNAQKGRLQHGFAFTGANGYRVDRLLSVAELIAELKEGYRAAAGKRQPELVMA
ncbi:MAG TPA: nitronate monooxygenase family protein [bacterium]|nr:nitronate monooxygenase family protein [bacterium]HPR89061.1 nitronate monooxygenase family protein [bacterium]